MCVKKYRQNIRKVRLELKKENFIKYFFTDMSEINLKILLCFNFEFSVKTQIKSEQILIQIVRNCHYTIKVRQGRKKFLLVNVSSKNKQTNSTLLL